MIRSSLVLALLITSSFSHARELVPGLRELACQNWNFRVASLETSPAELKIVDSGWEHTNRENLEALIGTAKADRVAGVRVKGPQLTESCKHLRSDATIFFCAADGVRLDLLDGRGEVLASVDDAYLSVDSSLRELRVHLTLVTEKSGQSWKHFTMDSKNLWFDFDSTDPMNPSFCRLKP